MKSISISAIALAALMALPAVASSQTVSIPWDGTDAIPVGKMAYTVSLEGCGIDIAEITSNQNVTVTTTKDKWDDTIYKYDGTFAVAQWDSYDGTFVEGNYIQSPAINLEIDNATKSLVFGWNNIENTDWKADVDLWRQYVAEQNTGMLRINIPAGLFTVKDTSGKEYSNAAQTIMYEFIGTTPLATIESVTPSTATPLTVFDGCTFKFTFPEGVAPSALSSEVITSDLKFFFTPAGSTEAAKDYTPKSFTFNASEGTIAVTFAKNGEKASFTAPGTYTLSAASHLFLFADANDKTVATTRSFEYSWTVEEPVTRIVGFEPADGVLDTENIYDQGIASVGLRLSGGVGSVNPDKELFAKLYRDGKLIAQVPNTNYRLVKYDGIYANRWEIAFWQNPQGRAKVPGEYTVEIPKGFFVLNGVESAEAIHHYTIKCVPYIVNPEQGDVDSFGAITFTWPDATAIELDLSDPEQHPYLFVMNADDEDASMDYTYAVNGNMLTITPKEIVTISGRWDAGVPSEIVTIITGEGETATREIPSYSISATYNIASGKAVRPTSSLNEVEKTLPAKITFTMPEGIELIGVNTMGKTYVYPVNADGSYGASVATFRGAKDDKTNFTITNIAGDNALQYLANGKYAIVLADHLFRTDQSELWSRPMAYEFTVKNDVRPYTTNPYDGESIRTLEKFEVTLPADAIIPNGAVAYITDGVTTFTANPRIKEGDSKTVEIIPAKPITIAGDYTLNTEIQSKGENNQNVIYSIVSDFSIVGAEGQLVLPLPAIVSSDFSDDFKNVNIVLEYAEAGSLDNQLAANLYRIVDGEREATPVVLTATAEGTKVTLTGAGEFSNGKYELVLPEGFYFTADKVSRAGVIELNFNKLAIADVFGNETDSYTVYTIQGVCVMRGASADRVSELLPGLYIINGRKVIITK